MVNGTYVFTRISQHVCSRGGVCSGGCLFPGGREVPASGPMGSGGVCLLPGRGGSTPRGVSALRGVPASGPGGCLLPGGVCWGVSALGECLLEGVLASCPRGVCVSQHAMSQTPSCGQNDRQVQKYYLAPNFFCGGKNDQTD